MDYPEDNRRHDADHFYGLMHQLVHKTNGYRYLEDCHATTGWPHRGVYFFFEGGEFRSDGVTPRVVRVGTHALKEGSKTTLWGRLSQHKGHSAGSHAGGGNHRGSIFRLHVGTALLDARTYPVEIAQSWRHGSTAPAGARQIEHPLELDVSRYIGGMPFLWVDVPDAAGPESDRGVIETGAISLLSNARDLGADCPSPNWLGRRASSDKVRESGLWNVSHVWDTYEPGFLNVLERHINAM